MRKKINSPSGFSIIEVILVVVIVAILTTLPTALYSRFLLQNAVDNTTEQITGMLRKAQIYSMEGKQGFAWSVNYTGNTLTLYRGNVFGSRNPSFDETYTVNSNVSITGSTNNISFSRITGLPTPTTASFTVSVGTNSREILVNSQGVVDK